MIQPHELCTRFGLTRDKAIELLRLMSARGFGKLVNLEYHNCCAAPIAVLNPLDPGPSVCPECEQKIGLGEVRFDVALVKP